jgi:tRNA (guanine37-N1)-methyltransferase
MNFHVITLFPEVVDAYCDASILGRAQKDKKLKVATYQLRDFVRNPAKLRDKTADKWFYKRVDDKPYGGGPGMVLQAEPFVNAVAAIQKKIKKSPKVKSQEKLREAKPHVMRVLITAAGGKPFTNAYAKKLSKEKDVVILCGRYEGIDARVKKVLASLDSVVEEVSVGPYILTGGEVPALSIIDATARQIPGILGKIESLEEGRVASHDVYTRPEVLEYKNSKGILKKYHVPKVLLSGHHAHIDALRSKKRSTPKS